MSFSQEVKEELMSKYVKSAHCRKALFAALQMFDEKNVAYDAAKDCYIYHFTTEIKTFNMKTKGGFGGQLFEKACCKRAFLKGAFVGAGTLCDPEKEYRFDIICNCKEHAQLLQDLFAEFAISTKIALRRGKYVLYLKEGEAISDALNVLEAHKAMMQFENVRIVKEMRGSVNRQVNCETANIQKTVAAAMKQTEDIRLIAEKKGLESLDDNLLAVARARLSNPEVTLAELGNLMSPPVSKSAVNHRMRKLGELANTLRTKEYNR